MRKLSFFVFTLVLCFLKINSAEEGSILEGFLASFRIARLLTHNLVREYAKTPENVHRLHKNNKFQRSVTGETPFPCSTIGMRSDEKPKSVHKLKPGDIDVIGAIGDSLTAAAGLTAMDFIGVTLEERGKSFSIGGEGTWREYLTLPNILKEFNPNIIGYSLKSSLSIQKESQFNVAEIGAVSDNMPYMTNILIERIKTDKRVNLKNDWKMITFLIGDNDFCSELCYKNAEKALEKHRQDILTVLRLLRDNLPRTLVNFVVPPSIRKLASLTPKPPMCEYSHLVECPCIFGHSRIPYRQYYFDIMSKWQKIDLEVANLPEFAKDDFAVVVQPFFINITFPTKDNGDADFSYLSADCFHFSQKGNALVALNLWNNIMEPVGKKTPGGKRLFKKIICPSNKKPYIYTNKNSLLQ